MSLLVGRLVVYCQRLVAPVGVGLDLADPLWVLSQEDFECVKLLRNTLDVVEAIKKRRRGTTTPWASWKCLSTNRGLELNNIQIGLALAGMFFPFGMISIWSSLFSTMRLTARMFIQILLVLKYLNFLMDLTNMAANCETPVGKGGR